MNLFFKHVYRYRKTMLNFVPFLIVILVCLSIFWLLNPTLDYMEPLIVLLGFIIAMLQIAPAAILNAYPDARYLFHVELVYGGFHPNTGPGHLCINDDVSNPSNEILEHFQPFIEIRNISDETARIKGYGISKDVSLKNIAGKLEGPKLTDLPPNELTYFQILPFAEIIQDNYLIFISTEDGCKVFADKGAASRIILGWKKFQAHKRLDVLPASQAAPT